MPTIVTSPRLKDFQERIDSAKAEGRDVPVGPRQLAYLLSAFEDYQVIDRQLHRARLRDRDDWRLSLAVARLIGEHEALEMLQKEAGIIPSSLHRHILETKTKELRSELDEWTLWAVQALAGHDSTAANMTHEQMREALTERLQML